jgi:transposase
MISSVRSDGTTTCMTVEGATNTEVFRAYVTEVLLPTLHPGDVLVMDNLSAHKNKHTLDLLAAAGVQALFLPPYSPDLNPIELMWSKVKNLLRSAEARTQEELQEAIASALSSVTSKDAINWFAHCGYSFI